MNDNQTIAAISTAMAPGGIGMIRISGEQAMELADKVFRSISGRKLIDFKGYTGAYGKVYDKDGEIDECVAFVYRAPHSYTGENVVELCCHGGVYLVKRALRACIDAGARPAEPGEFTKRAFLNGKMGLTQAEAVMDLISAQGSHGAKAALSAREGAIYRKIHGVADQLLGISAGLAAWTDYPDEDIEEVSDENLTRSLAEVKNSLEKILRDYDTGKILREGVETVIIGRPNVGKSTLMNLLSGTQKSIVTQIPGTTRDVVEETIQLGEVILNLADTAGIRDTDDIVEAADVELAKQIMEADSAVDQMQKKIEGICFNLLIQQQPVARDLRTVTAAMKMVTDMERIGDHAADISEITILMGDNSHIDKFNHINKMAAETVLMLNDSIEAYVERNTEKAKQVIAHDDVVDGLFNEAKKDVIQLILDNPGEGEEATDLLMIAKYFERIGDHATNIAEWVIYSQRTAKTEE